MNFKVLSKAKYCKIYLIQVVLAVIFSAMIEKIALNEYAYNFSIDGGHRGTRLNKNIQKYLTKNNHVLN